jgi:hypothetical protein
VAEVEVAGGRRGETAEIRRRKHGAGRWERRAEGRHR